MRRQPVRSQKSLSQKPSLQNPKLQNPPLQNHMLAVLCLALGWATLSVYLQTAGFGFVTLDDPKYVTGNPQVLAGLTGPGVAWAFTTFTDSNWFPLTWLSLMLDCQLFGQAAGAHHVVNVVLHTLSAVLLFLALARATGRPWRSVLVAGLFALHPLHVESVAWITERKDVLSAFFGMLTLLLYVRYAEAPSARRYVPMALAFALALMSKSMLVTLPLVLLLVDFWPLRRLSWPLAPPVLKRLVVEKTPLLALSVAASLLALQAHWTSGHYRTLEALPLSTRLANACLSYVIYIGKAFWPSNLDVFYSYHEPSFPMAAAACGLLAAVTAACLRLAGNRPYLLTGWLWYLGMLVPVIGLVQVGFQSMADRYTYMPLIGLSIAVVWGAAELVERHGMLRLPAAVLAAVGLLLLSLQTDQQVAYWSDSETLYKHALAVDEQSALIRNDLAGVLSQQGDYADAIDQYREALRLKPDFLLARYNLAMVLRYLGRQPEAVAQYTQELQFSARRGDSFDQYSLGLCYATGQGLAQDWLKAYFWLSLAAGAGNENASAELKLAAQELSPLQKALIQKRVRSWTPKPETVQGF